MTKSSVPSDREEGQVFKTSCLPGRANEWVTKNYIKDRASYKPHAPRGERNEGMAGSAGLAASPRGLVTDLQHPKPRHPRLITRALQLHEHEAILQNSVGLAAG